MDSLKFYQITLDYLYGKAKKHTVVPISPGMSAAEITSLPRLTEADVNRYFSPTVRSTLRGDDYNNNLRRIFLRLCFHCQNGAFIREVINWEKNYNVISDFTCNFDAAAFLRKYPSEADAKTYLTKRLHTPSGRTTTVGEYAGRVFSFAKFVVRFNDYEDFVQTVLPYGALAPLYISMNTEGMKVLAYDFLKELDPRFDLCKPDKHISEIAIKLGLVKRGGGPFQDLKVSQAISDLAKDISNRIGETVSAYKLDKMLWLISSETFYFHDAIKNSTDEKREAYLAFVIRELALNNGSAHK